MVMLSRFTLAAVVSTMIGAATATIADFTILSPGGPDLWWVAKSSNVLAWTCHAPDAPATFTVSLGNTNTTIQTSPMAIISVQNNFDCSLIITQDQSNQAPGTGYFVTLANVLNGTDIYAQSQPFEIKAAGSTFPDPSSTPIEPGQASSTGGSSTGGAAPTASHSGASALGLSSVAAAAAAIFGLAMA